VATNAHDLTAPRLTGAALDAVRHHGSHQQIIASAVSGKTEVVSQRVADLLAEGRDSGRRVPMDRRAHDDDDVGRPAWRDLLDETQCHLT
jgi:hypothetical protein